MSHPVIRPRHGRRNLLAAAFGKEESTQLRGMNGACMIKKNHGYSSILLASESSCYFTKYLQQQQQQSVHEKYCSLVPHSFLAWWSTGGQISVAAELMCFPKTPVSKELAERPSLHYVSKCLDFFWPWTTHPQRVELELRWQFCVHGGTSPEINL